MATMTQWEKLHLESMLYLCEKCGWKGLGEDAVIQPDDCVRCKVCSAALIIDGSAMLILGGEADTPIIREIAR